MLLQSGAEQMNELDVRKWAIEKALEIEGEWKNVFPIANALADYVIHGKTPKLTQRGYIFTRKNREE